MIRSFSIPARNMIAWRRDRKTRIVQQEESRADPKSRGVKQTDQAAHYNPGIDSGARRRR
jgi:hypothetical protein